MNDYSITKTATISGIELKKFRIAFAATSGFACPFFEELQKSFEIVFLLIVRC
jgi:hypothetical protein